MQWILFKTLCFFIILGTVKEKEEAHKEYNEAISKGHGAYLMDEEKAVSLQQMYSPDVSGVTTIMEWMICSIKICQIP